MRGPAISTWPVMESPLAPPLNRVSLHRLASAQLHKKKVVSIFLVFRALFLQGKEAPKTNPPDPKTTQTHPIKWTSRMTNPLPCQNLQQNLHNTMFLKNPLPLTKNHFHNSFHLSNLLPTFPYLYPLSLPTLLRVSNPPTSHRKKRKIVHICLRRERTRLLATLPHLT